VIEGFAGVTAIDCSVGVVTVNVVEPDTAERTNLAVIVVVPAATPVARPLALIVAVAGVAEVQLTDAVRFCVVESV